MLNPLAIGVTVGGLLLDVVAPRPKPRAGLAFEEPSLLSTRAAPRTPQRRRPGSTNVVQSRVGRCAGVRGHGGEPADQACPRTVPALPCAEMATFAVKFLGCKVSQADAMLARSALLQAGHTEAPEDNAELHVINTCCITSEAEAKSRQSVRRSLRAAPSRSSSPDARRTCVPRQFAEIDPRVRPFVGTAEDVAAAMAGDLGACADLEHDVLAREQAQQAARTRGFVKVQDGCDCHCAYCIIPTVRGSARSRPAERRARARCDAASRRASPRW